MKAVVFSAFSAVRSFFFGYGLAAPCLTAKAGHQDFFRFAATGAVEISAAHNAREIVNLFIDVSASSS